MKSKTKITSQTKKKTDPELVKTIVEAKKNPEWKEVAGILSGPRRIRPNVNLGKINQEAKENNIVVIPGKVLSNGEITKKIKLVAFSFSQTAKEKLAKSKIQISNLLDEIKQNPKAKGITILK